MRMIATVRFLTALGRSSESGSLPPSHTPAPFHSVLAP